MKDCSLVLTPVSSAVYLRVCPPNATPKLVISGFTDED